MVAMRGMRDKLARIVAEVRVGTDAIAVAAGQVSTGNLDLSSRTEQQADSLQETSSSMEELTSSVHQTAESARRANMMAVSASTSATKGGEVVAQVIDTMSLIDAASKKIGNIISVIEGIAFQTNILALNAAVEAARAGEHGRGFAVVAGEVRNLAHRAASAAREIKALVNDSVSKVELGSRLVADAGAAMDEIVDRIRNVQEIMSGIFEANREQSAGIAQMNEAISLMDQVTQRNAALVEDAATASVALREQAASLAGLVSTFNVDGVAGKGEVPALPECDRLRLARAA